MDFRPFLKPRLPKLSHGSFWWSAENPQHLINSSFRPLLFCLWQHELPSSGSSLSSSKRISHFLSTFNPSAQPEITCVSSWATLFCVASRSQILIYQLRPWNSTHQTLKSQIRHFIFPESLLESGLKHRSFLRLSAGPAEFRSFRHGLSCCSCLSVLN